MVPLILHDYCLTWVLPVLSAAGEKPPGVPVEARGVNG